MVFDDFEVVQGYEGWLQVGSKGNLRCSFILAMYFDELVMRKYSKFENIAVRNLDFEWQ